MGLLTTLERFLSPATYKKKEQRVELKEIVCKNKGDDYLDRYRTAVVGTEYTNMDGSSRQDPLKKLKEGDRVALLWAPGKAEKKDIVYTVKRGLTGEIAISDCFGRLNDKAAAGVIRALQQDNVTTSARVAKITGGTRKKPRLGCVLEMTTYAGPPQKS
ncbi:MAG: hypothetical protein LJE65_17345 [Desulfobacteraceae bacterium]|jgi:hypothetical protein|nr:hypothetical protein [Desulfobacteraceae bacterium]